MSARNAVVRGSLTLAIAGWVVALLTWVVHGPVAGVLPGFIFALTAAATFTITFCVTIVMPDKARMHALGVIEGIRLAQAAQGGGDPAPEGRERHLRVM